MAIRDLYKRVDRIEQGLKLSCAPGDLNCIEKDGRLYMMVPIKK